MNFKFRACFTRVFLPLILLTSATASHAIVEKQIVVESPHRARAVRVVTPRYAEADAELLRSAYRTLEKADHDYNGNRKRAMKEIEHAAKEMGMNLKGDGHGGENQGTSDEQLGRAKGLLEQAQGNLSGKEGIHVRRAIAHLNTALKIR